MPFFMRETKAEGKTKFWDIFWRLQQVFLKFHKGSGTSIFLQNAFSKNLLSPLVSNKMKMLEKSITWNLTRVTSSLLYHQPPWPTPKSWYKAKFHPAFSWKSNMSQLLMKSIKTFILIARKRTLSYITMLQHTYP